MKMKVIRKTFYREKMSPAESILNKVLIMKHIGANLKYCKFLYAMFYLKVGDSFIY